MTNTNKNEKSPKITNMVMVMLLLTIPLSGCVGDTENDRELVIVTYDVYALTDEVIEEFENETGISVTILKLNDAGSILDYLINTKEEKTWIWPLVWTITFLEPQSNSTF